MKEICTLAACTGCMACVNVCAHGAISVKADAEGFDRPYIDASLCVDCGLCIKTCPINNHPIVNEARRAYSGWSRDESVRVGSSSGGAFSEVARPIIEDGGVVFGCALNDQLQAEHMYVETMEDLELKLRGSKYVQSRIGSNYAKAKEFLQQGRKVLFSGTPCQIAGLKNYLRRYYDNLWTVDLICHGVPSPMLFESYKSFMQKRENIKLTNVSFRCKKSSWIFYNMTLKGHVEKNGALKEYIGCYYEDPYIRGFLRDYFIRPSCYQCRFTSTERCGDFTIADWWGYRKESPQDKDFQKKGVSLVLANTDKAERLLPKLNMSLQERTIEEAKMTNVSLSHPFAMPDGRAKFWEDYKRMTFEDIVDKYMYPEKVNWRKSVLQHYSNTDALLFALNVAWLPQRVLNKIKRVVGLKK